MKIKPLNFQNTQGIQPVQAVKSGQKKQTQGVQQSSGGSSLLDRLNGMDNKLESGGIAAHNKTTNGIKPGGIADHNKITNGIKPGGIADHNISMKRRIAG